MKSVRDKRAAPNVVGARQLVPDVRFAYAAVKARQRCLTARCAAPLGRAAVDRPRERPRLFLTLFCRPLAACASGEGFRLPLKLLEGNSIAQEKKNVGGGRSDDVH